MYSLNDAELINAVQLKKYIAKLEGVPSRATDGKGNKNSDKVS